MATVRSNEDTWLSRGEGWGQGLPIYYNPYTHSSGGGSRPDREYL